MDFSPFLDLKAYNKLEIIGEGGFSKVVKIQNKKTGKIYAAKILFDQINEYSSEQITYISREVNILANIKYPSIIKFVGYSPINFKQTAKTTIVTEYLPYGSLFDILEKERSELPPPFWTMTKKLINIYGIASGMSYLHSRNIIHRDLKPQNILEDEYLFPKISDFGLSKVIQQETDSTSKGTKSEFKGTPIYVPPETWKFNEYTKSSDVYSFSLIVYEIFMNQTPFNEFSNICELVKYVPNGYRPEIDEKVPEAYRNLISRCWSNEESERPTFEEIVKELRTNRLFITEDIDEEEYNKYIEFIEENSPHNEKTFDEDEYKDKGIKINKGRTAKEFFDILIQRNYVEYLPETIREIVNEIIERSASEANSNKIHIKKEETRLLYANHSFDNTEFITLMNSFKEISIEIEYLTKEFESIIDQITKMKKEEIPNIEIIIIITVEFKQEFQNNQYINTVLIKSQMNEIPDSSFLNCASLTKVYLPETIEIIKVQGFKKCFLLRRIILPESVKVIEDDSFSDCSSLEKINIPSSVTKIGNESFLRCLKLKKISIEESVTSFGNQCFMKCCSLTKIMIPSSVKKIGKECFYGCSSLMEAILSSSIEILPESCFEKCTSLKSITIPSSVKMIEDKCFYECSSLTEATLSSSIEILPESCFEKCTSLKSIIIPSSVKMIEDKCFYECSSLTEATLSSSIEILPESCFEKCTSLESIIIPSSVKAIEKNCFYQCSSLKEVTIPDSVEAISSYCFADCVSLTQIKIPSSVKKLNGYCFEGCTSLTNIEISQKTTLIRKNCFHKCISLKEITIPSSVVSIGINCFMECTSLEEITIPTSCKEISSSCFAQCISLKKIKMHPSVAILANYCFDQCSSLEEITIPQSVNTIGSKAFRNCSSLRKVVIMPYEICLKKLVFENVNSVQEVYVRANILNQINENKNVCHINGNYEIKFIEEENIGEELDSSPTLLEFSSISLLNIIRDHFLKIPIIIGVHCQKMNMFIPPIKQTMRSGEYLSISIYDKHSTFINSNHEIFIFSSSSSTKNPIWEQIKVTQTRRPISSVCGSSYTLYLIEKEEEGEEKYEIIYNNAINNKRYSVSIDRRDKFQISLYGGERNAGTILYYNEIMIFCEGEEGMKIKKLPSEERCIFLACTNYSIYAQCSNGKVYSYKIKRKNNKIEEEKEEYEDEEVREERTEEFEEVRELSGANIISISGTSEHCIAVSSTGAIYVEGNNKYGQLGFCSLISRINKFLKIEVRNKHIESPICRVYAGKYHSIFVSNKGQIYCSGLNENGELFIKEENKTKKTKKNKRIKWDIYRRASSTIIKGSTNFCIAGNKTSILFINCEPSPNTPNQQIKNSS